MTDITAAEFRIAEKVARSLGFVTAQSYADHAARLESVGVTLDAQLAQTLRQVASPSFADRADYWGTLATAALEFLTSTGRLIPAGGMALTAEQVEDVRLLAQMCPWWSAEHVEQVQARVRAMLPVAVHAGDDRCPEVNVMNDQCCFLLGHDGLHRACGYKWSTAPAEPAEEETKAERDSQGIIRINGGRIVALSCDTREMVQRWFDIAKPGSKWQRDYAAALDLFDREAASSPVVPTPTETGPWQRIEDVPESVYLIKDCEGDKKPDESQDKDWKAERGFRWHPGFPDRFAPFVAAEEG